VAVRVVLEVREVKNKLDKIDDIMETLSRLEAKTKMKVFFKC